MGAGKRAIHDVADLTRGSLRIAVTPTFTSYFIGPLMADFYVRATPASRSGRQEMSQEKIEDLLCRDELDVGITFAPVHSPELEAIPLLTESLALKTWRNIIRWLPVKQVALSRLHDEKLVLLSVEFATREQIDHYCEKAGLHPQVVIEAQPTRGSGWIRRTSLSTLLPAAIATQHDGLKAISLAPPLLERTAVLLRRKNSWQTAAAKAFLHMALEECADVGENESR
ncbi:LysR substrate-binding domain-containing protein [Escherichia coli]